jgi:S-phase kinase-associated protein 1
MAESDRDSVEIHIETSDKRKFVCVRKELTMSATIQQVTEDCDVNPNGTMDLPLPSVDGETFEKIREYMIYHTEHPNEHIDYRGDDKTCEDVGPWDREYCKAMNNDLLFRVIMAANYLAMPDLLTLTCKTVASMIKGKTPEQIREVLALKPGETIDC